MTLATRCPACGTAFRVVSDQLRVSSGWVRCGRCRTPFDALEHLFRHASSRVPQPEPPVAAPPQAFQNELPTELPAELPSAELPAELPGEGAADSHAESPPESPAEPAPEFPTEPPATQPSELLEPSPDERPSELPPPAPALDVDPPLEAFTTGPDELAAPVPMAAPASTAEPASPPPDEPPLEPLTGAPALPTPEAPVGQPAPAAGSSPTAEPYLEPRQDPPPLPHADEPVSSRQAIRDSSFRPPARPGFVRRAEAAARWSHPATRATLGLLTGVLVLLLAAQATVLWRDEAALRWPTARPALEVLCAGLGCRVDAPRRIQALAVEASELRRDDANEGYRLELTVRNRSALEVRSPALELSLTDSAGRLIARRVLTLAELGIPARTVGPGQELVVQAELSAGPEPVVGYTIALFYP